MPRRERTSRTVPATSPMRFGEEGPLTRQQEELRRTLRDKGEEVGRKSVETARADIKKQIRIALEAVGQQ